MLMRNVYGHTESYESNLYNDNQREKLQIHFLILPLQGSRLLEV